MVAKKTQKESGTWSEEDFSVAHEALLEAVAADNLNEEDPFDSIQPFMSLFVSSNASRTLRPGLSSRDQKNMLIGSIKEFSKAPLKRFLAGLDQLVDLVARSGAHQLPRSDDYEDDEDEEVANDPRSSKALFFLKLSTMCLQSLVDYYQSQEKPSVPNEALQLAIRLHDTLFSMSNSGSDAQDTQNSISVLCESWWAANLPQKNALVVQTIPVLATSALEDKSSLKRLFQMRKALNLIDFTDKTSDSLRMLLGKLVSSSPIKLVHGRQLVAYLLQIDPILRSDIHASIKAQLPESKSSMNECYGDVYLRAWKEGDVLVRPIIEDLFQDLIDSALHVAHPTLHENLVEVLEPFHHLRKGEEGQEALNCLYGPVLWRSFKASNAQVRAHAVELLEKVFPLASKGVYDESIRKACKALRQSLGDSDARVRVCASRATAGVLGTFWNTIPAAEIRSLLNVIVAEHASDSTSSSVRVGALNAVTMLLEVSSDSHAVLRGLLPALGNLIHDKAEKVRVAAVQMLLTLKQLPNFKYYKIVPPEHLQARLAAEANPTNTVSKLLTSLVASSYLPPSKPPSVQLDRTIKVLAYPEAARTFYTNLHACVPVEGIVKLCSLLLTYLCSAVEGSRNQEKKAKMTKRRRTRDEEADSEDEDDDDELTAEDTELVSCVAETIDILWGSIEKELSKNAELQSDWMEMIQGSTLRDLLEYFEEAAAKGNDPHCYRACGTVLRLAGRMPPESVEGLVSYISQALKTKSANFSTHIALLCMWGMADQVGPALAQSIQGGLEGDSLFDDSSSGNRRASPRNLNLVVPDLKPSTALKILHDLLRGADPSCIAARQSLLQSMVSSEALQQTLWLGTRQAERILPGDSSYVDSIPEPEIDFILQVSETYGRFVLHKQGLLAAKTNALSKQGEQLLTWVSEKVIPALSTTSVPFDDPNLSTIAADTTFTMTPLSPPAQGPSRRRANRQRTPIRLDDSEDAASSGNSTSAGSRIAKAVASSLLQSVCVIFSDWLAVGGDGGSSISVTASQWCKVLPGLDESHAEPIVSALSRLALQLASKSENFTLLKNMLLHCPDQRTGSSIVRQTFESLAKVRGSSADVVVTKTIDTVLDAVSDLQTKLNCESELPSSLLELWPSNEGCVRSSLLGVLSSKQTSTELATRLVDDFCDHLEMPVNVSLFRARCLWILTDAENCVISGQVRKMVRRIDPEGFESENGLRNMIEEVKAVA